MAPIVGGPKSRRACRRRQRQRGIPSPFFLAALPRRLSHFHGLGCGRVTATAPGRARSILDFDRYGAGDRNRTRDLPLTRRLLYQLSYAGAKRTIAGEAGGDKQRPYA